MLYFQGTGTKAHGVVSPRFATSFLSNFNMNGSFINESKQLKHDAFQGIENSLKVTYSIQPTQSLVSSSQLIADYMADKIEQSVPIQQLFNELLRFFESEAECLGPAFNTDTTCPEELLLQQSVKLQVQDSGDSNTEHSIAIQRSQIPKVLGFRIVCSGRLQMSSFSKPAEKAESIVITRGLLPLNTMKANIDFAQTYSTNPYGTCGIKV